MAQALRDAEEEVDRSVAVEAAGYNFERIVERAGEIYGIRCGIGQAASDGESSKRVVLLGESGASDEYGSNSEAIRDDPIRGEQECMQHEVSK